MLTIKKRFPSEKLYLYGGTAFIAGFAGVMLVLVQTNTHVRDFMVSNPVSFETKAEKTAQQETKNTAPTQESIVSQEQVFSRPTQQSSAATPTQTTQEQQPTTTTEEPTPTEPTIPVEPTPTDPVPTDPEPEEPTDPIEVIIDILP